MKRKLFTSLLAIFMLAGCGSNTSSVEEAPAGSSSVSESTSQESSSQNSVEHVDYVNSPNARLMMDYTGKDFYTDGITQVELVQSIDGDTAHFRPKSGNTEKIKSRFYGIDTPESTGAIEEYGHAASEFTSAKLNEANKNGTIVVSGPFDAYSTPEPDSTGSRYLSLIWINTSKKNAPFNELVLLNLWIVQEGYSWAKNVGSMPRLADIFLAAEAQARNEKLNLFSGQPDGWTNHGEYEDVSLLDIKHEVEKHLADTTYVNAFANKNVRVHGTVTGYANNTLYLQQFFTKEQGGDGSAINPYTKEEGEYAGINIFTGMGAIASKFSAVGTYLSVCGTCVNSENFGFQITDASFIRFPEDDDMKAARVIFPAEDNIEDYVLYEFSMSSAELTNDNYAALYSPISLTDSVTVTRGYTSDDNYVTLYVKDSAGKQLPFGIYIPFFYKDDNNNILKADDFVGKTFNLKGVYSFHESSGRINYQVVLRDKTDLVEVVA